jgi:hypothetical protein
MEKPFHVALYGRPGCCVCDRAGELLQSLGTEYPHELHRFNIDNDPVPAQKW